MVKKATGKRVAKHQAVDRILYQYIYHDTRATYKWYRKYSVKFKPSFLYKKKEQQTIILIILTLILDCPTLCSVYKIYSTTFVCTCSRFSF